MTNQQDNGAASAQATVKGAATGSLAKPGQTMKDLVALQGPAIARALGNALDPGRYVRIVQTELTKTPKLMSCTPASVLGAVMTAAQLGIEFGPMGQAYLVPYGASAQLIIGYKGWVALTHRSGLVASVTARIVHENDFFDYEFGSNEFLVHKPAKTNRGEAVAYYCVAKTLNEGTQFDVMTKSEVMAHRERYAKKVSGSFVGPWKDNFDEMARKTVFLRVKSFLPMSSTMADATAVDGAVISQMTPEDEPEVSYDIEGEVID